MSHARRLIRENGLTLVHAFDDPAIIAGQGTIGLELLEQAPDLDVLVVPVGGGGLIAGIGLAVREAMPGVRVIGVQARASAAFVESYRADRRISVKGESTVADGIAVGTPGRLTLPLAARFVDDMVTVEEDEITQAMTLLLERCKLLVEGAGAVGLAAVLGGKIRVDGKRVAVVLSGGNVDSNLVARVLEHGLSHAGRYLGATAVDRGPPRPAEPAPGHCVGDWGERAGDRPPQARAVRSNGARRGAAYAGDQELRPRGGGA